MKSAATPKTAPQDAARAAPFQRALLSWYGANKRDLPWRSSKDPYSIWVSEVMLQQTRVAAVIQYYTEFLRRFPDVETLAAAPESEVLAVWSGLGYYRRARRLHLAAKHVVQKREGKVPTTHAELLQLPGIGKYTAAAIASIAFDQPFAVVDGNVERVLLRLAGRKEWSPADHWADAQELIDRKRPGDFNQAMMELGATLCQPQQPRCKECPVKRFCQTRGEHARVVRPARRTGQLHYAFVRNKFGRLKLVQRPASDPLMAGMWELPSAVPHNFPEPILRLRHSITVTDYRVLVFSSNEAVSPAKKKSAGKWFTPQDAAKLPLTGVTRKALRTLGFLKPTT